MIISPQYVKFETPSDVIDYVTRGLPPTKDDFNNLMKKIKLPDDWQTSLDNQGKEITISEKVFDSWNEEEIEVLYATLDRVYVNRCRNRNIACGVLAAVAVTGAIIAITS